MENPRGLLALQEYMQKDRLPVGWLLAAIDQCAFGRDYKKSTHLWHNFQQIQFEGVTGDGRCHGRCGKGEWVGGYFRHFKALAVEPERGPRGKGHTKEKNALPRGLLELVLAQAVDETPRRGAKGIVDLCSGFQSWRPVALEHGCSYVAVDVLGDRNYAKGGEGRADVKKC